MLAPLALLSAFALPLTEGDTITLPKTGGFDFMNVDTKYNRIYAAHSGAGCLAVLDLSTMKATEVETGEINGVQTDDTLDRIFVTGALKKVIALDRKTFAKLAEADLAGPGDDLVMDPKRRELYVCNDDGVVDWVFNPQTLNLIGSVTIAGAPEYVEYYAKTDKLYQNIKPTNQLQVIDPATKKVIANWDTGEEKGPHGLAIDRRSGRAFSAGSNGKMNLFDLATGKIITTLDVAPGIDQIVFDPGLRRVYCAGHGAISVAQETAEGAVSLGNVPSPAGVHTITVDPKTHTVWVCYADQEHAYLKSFKAAQ